jgi:hypothetical protein
MLCFCCHENIIFATIVHFYIDECSWKNTNAKFLLPKERYIFHDCSSLYRQMFMEKHNEIFFSMRMIYFP